MPPAILIHTTGTKLRRTYPIDTIIAVVIVKAVEPAAKRVQGFVFVARARRRRASLSVSSATNMVEDTVANATTKLSKSKFGKTNQIVFLLKPNFNKGSAMMIERALLLEFFVLSLLLSPTDSHSRRSFYQRDFSFTLRLCSLKGYCYLL